jgi:serine/threonine protein kinase
LGAPISEGHVIAGRYEIKGRIGKGGMGVIYRAHDRMLDEPVALKVLRQEYLETPGMDERFRSEIKLARKVGHKNVCRIFEYGEAERIRYIAMELIEGRDLKHRLDSLAGGLPVPEAYETAIQTAMGLQAIHELGIIHRDLKTPNIMLDASGRVKLMDFGIAKDATQAAPSRLTSAGFVMGTPEYMSPEQCRGATLDFRSDIYSLGVVFYEMFTGDLPFRAETPVAIVMKQIRDPFVPSDAAVEKIPRPMLEVLHKMLEKRPQDRYQDLAGVIEALQRARATTDLSAAAPAETVWPDVDRREETRLDIFVNAVLKRLGPDQRVLRQERTIAENISRRGARVMTSMTDIARGDVVIFEEAEGQFSTRAEVRNSLRGRDNVHRLHLRFLDKRAPDRLVRTDS